MEYQLITGYDDTGFLTAQPWPGMGFPPAHLTFGSWAEMGNEVHVNYFTLEKVAAADERTMVRDSLAYAVDLYHNPTRHADGDYAVGAGAWDNFAVAVKGGQGSSHGNWWNATVWSECRAMAAAYLSEVAERFPAVRDEARRLSIEYRSIADYLLRISDKGLEQQAKLALLVGAAAREERCIEGLEALAGKL
jgi:hypothetical protein